MKNKIYLSLLLALCSVSVGAQTVQLREMLKQGIENNYSLKIVRSQQQQAENNATYANAGGVPTVSVTADYDFDYDNYSKKNRADNSIYDYENNDHNLSAGVGLSYTIFDGFSIQTNYQKYKELENQSKIATRIAIEDYIAQFTAEYFNNIKEKQRLKNLESAMKLSGERLRIVNARYLIGTFSRLDLLQARVDFNVDSAAYIKQQEIVYTSSINLSRLLSTDDDFQATNITDSVINVDRVMDYANLLEQMVQNNSSLLYVNKNTVLAELDYKAVKSRDYPYLKFDLGYGFSYNTYSRSSTLRSRYHGVGAGLSLGFNIFDPTKKTAKRNAIIDRNIAKMEIKDLEDDLRAQFLTFWQAYLNNAQLLELEEVSQSVAKENYEIANERYMLGDLSGIEMREAENSLLDAENRILDVVYNMKICEISLLQISGNLEYYL